MKRNITRLIVVLILSFFVSDVLNAGTSIYVSSTGSDTKGDGSISNPFASFQRARDFLRDQRKTGKQLSGETVVWVREGAYLFTNSFELTVEDSGTSDCPVVWRAYQGEKVRVIGGVFLDKFEKVSDEEIKSRLAPQVKEKVLSVDLKKIFPNDKISNFINGQLKSRGFGRSITVSHHELFLDGKPMELARYPDRGDFLKISKVPDSSAIGDEHGGKLGRLEEGFYYPSDVSRRWKDLDNIWVHGYWAWDWANSYEKVESIDLEKGYVKTASPYGLYGFRVGQRFYFLNILEELDQPFEWYLDFRNYVIYFLPPDGFLEAGDNSAKHELLLSLLGGPIFKLSNASYITIEGFVIEATRGNGIEIYGGTSNKIIGSVIRNIGDYGVRIHNGQGHGVISCDIFDTGDGGVSLEGGDRKTLTAAGHYVENCHFARQGRWSKCYVPAILIDGVGNRASNNLIHEHPHCGILFSGNDHIIEFNEIYRVALETGDVGAIYTGRDYTYRGNKIRYNYIHHTGGVGMGSMGVYMDDCVSGTEIYGNIFYKVQRAVFLGGGRDHLVENNVFVDCNHAVEVDGRGLDRSPVWRNMVDKTMRERLKAVPLDLYRSRYPELKDLDKYYGIPGIAELTGESFKGIPPENNRIIRNVCVGKWLNIYWNAQTNMIVCTNNFVGGDPMFLRQPGDGSDVNVFEIKDDSPVFQTGFKKIPLSKIGLQDDKYRKGIKALNL